jgi:hypothetical protein
MADFDLSQIQGLLGQFQPSEEDKRRALTQALASAGFGILGARNVNGVQALGQGGLIGMQSYNNALADASAAKKAGLQDAMGAMQVQGEMQKLKDAQRLRDVQADLAAKFAPGQSSLPQQPPAMGGGSAASLMNAALGGSPVAPPSAPQAPVVPDKRAVAQRYQAMGDYLMSKGFQPQAQQYYDLAQKSLPQIKDQQVRVDPKTGQRVVVNVYNDGTQEILRDVAPDREKLNFQNTGGAIVGLDPFTGQPGSAAIPTSMTPSEKANLGLGYARLAEEKRRNDAMEGDPAQIESIAQLIAAGKMPPPSGFAAARPVSQAIMARVSQINPDYSAIDYNTGKKAEADFATGKNGNTVRSLNVAISHLDTLGNLADALKNGNIQVFNKASQAIAQQTGNPVPTNFDAAKKIVADEIVKAIVGTGGGVADREQAVQTINRANSPAQLRGVINTYTTLMGGQLHGLQQQYETNTKRKDFNRFLSPETQRLLAPLSAGSDVRSAADKILSGG